MSPNQDDGFTTYTLSQESFRKDLSVKIPGFYEEDEGITATKAFIGGSAAIVACSMIFTIVSSKSL
jgi:hypothetical protein